MTFVEDGLRSDMTLGEFGRSSDMKLDEFARNSDMKLGEIAADAVPERIVVRKRLAMKKKCAADMNLQEIWNLAQGGTKAEDHTTSHDEDAR